MSCITKLLELKGNNEILRVNEDVVIEGGGKYKDYEYLITFTSCGTRCAYVALKQKETEIFDKQASKDDYFYPDLNCHGGVTFYGNSPIKDILPASCDDKWVGFDANHGSDKRDVEKLQRYFPNDLIHDYLYTRPGTIKSYDYMKKECHGIINQLLEIQ